MDEHELLELGNEFIPRPDQPVPTSAEGFVRNSESISTSVGPISWRRKAFTLEKDYMSSALTLRPMEELLTIAYMTSVRRMVTDVGLSYLASYSGRHRCLAAGDKVFMADSTWKNIEDIEMGDTVFSPQSDGALTVARVIDLHRHFENDVFNVMDMDMKKIAYTCSYDHKIPIYGKRLNRTAEYISGYKSLPSLRVARIEDFAAPSTKKIDFGEVESKYCAVRPVSIRCVKTKPQMVYGFTLDSPSGLFITNDWLITHNSGKSLTACLMGWLWDPSFDRNFESRVVQSPTDFVNAMETIIKDKIEGAAIVVDEAGATMAASDWYEKWLRAIQKTLQICGMLKPMILFVAPNRDFIVSGMRKLLIAEYYLERNDPQFTTCVAYQVKYSSIKHDYYYKKPIVRLAGQNIQLRRIILRKPPEEFIDRYRGITEHVKLDLMHQFSEEVKGVMAEKNQDAVDFNFVIQDIFDKKELYFGKPNRDGVPTIDTTIIAIEYNLSPKHAKYVVQKIQRRLYEKLKEDEELAEIQEEKQEQLTSEDEAKRAIFRKASLKKRPLDPDILQELEATQKAEKLEEADEELKHLLEEL